MVLLSLVQNDLIKLIRHPTILILLFSSLVLLSVIAFLPFPDVISIFLVMEYDPYVTYYFVIFWLWGFLLVLFLNFVIYLSFQMEEDNRSQKYFNTLPIRRYLFYWSKLLSTIVFLIAWLSLAFLIAWLCLLFLSNFIQPETYIGYQPNTLLFLRNFTKLFLLLLGAVVIHTALSSLIKNKATLFVLSFLLPILSLSQYLNFLPYSYPVYNSIIENGYRVDNKADFSPIVGSQEILCIGFVLLFIFLTKIILDKAYE